MNSKKHNTNINKILWANCRPINDDDLDLRFNRSKHGPRLKPDRKWRRYFSRMKRTYENHD